MKLESKLGHGTQGLVFSTNRNSAIKVHANEEPFVRETKIYQRLQAQNVTSVCNCIIPTLYDYDDSLFIIEMSIVTPPYILDFGGAYLDFPPSHYSNTDVNERKGITLSEQFGDDVESIREIIATLESKYSIYVLDVNAGNIRLS